MDFYFEKGVGAYLRKKKTKLGGELVKRTRTRGGDIRRRYTGSKKGTQRVQGQKINQRTYGGE